MFVILNVTILQMFQFIVNGKLIQFTYQILIKKYIFKKKTKPISVYVYSVLVYRCISST